MLGNKVSYAADAYEACDGADIVAILTEWPEFKVLDLDRIKSLMKTPKILDLRNLLSKDKAAELGFDYACIGFCAV